MFSCLELRGLKYFIIFKSISFGEKRSRFIQYKYESCQGFNDINMLAFFLTEEL